MTDPPVPPMPTPVPAFRAQLISSHDGDTVTFLLDNWFYSRAGEAVRLADVHAPETSPMQPGGAETRALVNDWLMTAINRNAGTPRPLAWPFRVLTQLTSTAEPDQRQTFTRYVGWVYETRTGACLNADVNAFLRLHPEWPTGKAVPPWQTR